MLKTEEYNSKWFTQNWNVFKESMRSFLTLRCITANSFNDTKTIVPRTSTRTGSTLNLLECRLEEQVLKLFDVMLPPVNEMSFFKNNFTWKFFGVFKFGKLKTLVVRPTGPVYAMLSFNEFNVIIILFLSIKRDSNSK